jgi:hypothetical protein
LRPPPSQNRRETKIAETFAAQIVNKAVFSPRDLKGSPIMKKRVFKCKHRVRFLTALLTASLFAGCQPAGTGSIDVDRTSSTVKGFKSIEPVKRPKPARTSNQPAGTKSAARTGVR